MGDRWESRISRIKELHDRHSVIAPALRFYQATLECQSDLSRRFEKALDSSTPLRRQIDVDATTSALAAILAVSVNEGSELVREQASSLRTQENEWPRLIELALCATDQPGEFGVEDFFLRSSLQPLAENLQLQIPKDPNYNLNRCSACGGLPQMAVLRPEGEGASRSLLCSFCLREWNYRRVVCPSCGEEDRAKLPRFSSQECAYVHVEACDTCKCYVKAVDLSVDGHAIPLVDEAALAVLDAWAKKTGYTKLVPNLIGF